MRSITNHNSWQDLNEYLTTLTTSNKSSLAGTIFETLCKYLGGFFIFFIEITIMS